MPSAPFPISLKFQTHKKVIAIPPRQPSLSLKQLSRMHVQQQTGILHAYKFEPTPCLASILIVPLVPTSPEAIYKSEYTQTQTPLPNTKNPVPSRPYPA